MEFFLVVSFAKHEGQRNCVWSWSWLLAHKGGLTTNLSKNGKITYRLCPLLLIQEGIEHHRFSRTCTKENTDSKIVTKFVLQKNWKPCTNCQTITAFTEIYLLAFIYLRCKNIHRSFVETPTRSLQRRKTKTSLETCFWEILQDCRLSVWDLLRTV